MRARARQHAKNDCIKIYRVYNGASMMQLPISSATKENWKRLGTSLDPTRLRSRANKTCSTKLIFPVEDMNNVSNLCHVNSIVDYILNEHIEVGKALFSISVNLLNKRVENSQGIAEFINEYQCFGTDPYLLNVDLPADEEDLLGVIYQAMTPVGTRSLKGQYYTPRSVAKQVLSSFNLLTDGYVLDPCCGSGNFLCEARVLSPEQLLGVDIDPMAVMIAKVNLMLAYCRVSFIPRIFCGDFPDSNLFNSVDTWLTPYRDKISAICTNPPWGAASKAKGEETFSSFIRRGIDILKDDGLLFYVLPESFGKIKTHAGIRRYVLANASLESVVYLPPLFSGVFTSCLYIRARKSSNPMSGSVRIERNGNNIVVNQRDLYMEEDTPFMAHDPITLDIIDMVRNKGRYNLSNSIWALGIVTGDNKNKVSKKKYRAEWKPVCTGKDVRPYFMSEPTSYVRYVRSELQQVAREDIYNAREKLVYKFISDTLCFAYDNTGVLLLNSANILIPHIPNMSIKTVLAFLNSDIFRFLYRTKFDDMKILKGNLCTLPFPEISHETDVHVTRCVDAIIGGDAKMHQYLQGIIYDIFNLSNEHKQHIRMKLYGKTRGNHS